MLDIWKEVINIYAGYVEKNVVCIHHDYDCDDFGLDDVYIYMYSIALYVATVVRYTFKFNDAIAAYDNYDEYDGYMVRSKIVFHMLQHNACEDNDLDYDFRMILMMLSLHDGISKWAFF